MLDAWVMQAQSQLTSGQLGRTILTNTNECNSYFSR